MRIAITGANGFVGSNLAEYLQSIGHDVCSIVRQSADLSLIDDSAELRYVDYNDRSSLIGAFSECDILIHNAGLTKATSMQQMYLANVQTTVSVLDAVEKLPNLKRFIYISSQAAGRPSHNLVPVTEEQKSLPLTWYGKSKLFAEQHIRTNCKIPWTIIRPASVYGGGDKDFLELFKLITKGINIQIGYQDKYLSLIYIKELCEFIALSIACNAAENQIFYAADGYVYRQNDISDAIMTVLDKKCYKLKVPMALFTAIAKAGDAIGLMKGSAQLINTQKHREITAPGWICSIAKAKELLSWNPRAKLIQNIEETVRWYKENSYL